MRKIWFLSITALLWLSVGAENAFAQSPTSTSSSALDSDNDFPGFKEEIMAKAKSQGFFITWDDIVNTPALKGRGGSPLFQFYLFSVTGDLDRLLRDDGRIPEDKRLPKEHKEYFAHLCRDPDCREGLDLDKITPEALYLIMDYAGSNQAGTVPISNEGVEKPSETIWLLQGFLLPFGLSMGPMDYQYLFDSGQYETPVNVSHIESVTQFLMGIENLTEIVVNLPHQFGWEANQHQDVNLFMQLGRIIKQRNLKLRIVGQCETLCANYLLPAARTVIIEPYGYIYTEGSMNGQYLGGQLSVSAQKDYQQRKLRKEWLPQLTPVRGSYDLLAEVVTEGMLIHFGLKTPPGQPGIPKEQQKEMANGFIEQLKNWGQSHWGEKVWVAFDNMLTEHKESRHRSFENWDKDDINEFVRSLTKGDQGHVLKELAIFIKVYGDQETYKWTSHLNNMEWLKQYTIPYHSKVTRALSSRISYSYGGLLDLVSHLVWDPAYEKLFSVPKTYYAVPESEKPAVAAPSAGLLRLLGMNVIGENNQDMLARAWGDKVLHLDERIIKNCDFFNSLFVHLLQAGTAQRSQTPPFTKDTFTACTLKE